MNSLDSSTTTTSSSSCPFVTRRTDSSNTDEQGTLEDKSSVSKSSGQRSERVSSFKNATSCPFAQALHNHNDIDDSSSSTSTEHSATSTMLSSPPSPGSPSLRWKECPVFANHSCPFKDVKSSDEVSQILMQLPASHTDHTLPTHAVLIETLAYFHRDQAMEEYSITAIMSRLVQEYHFESQEKKIRDGLDVDGDEFPMKVLKQQENTENKNQEHIHSEAIVKNNQDTELLSQHKEQRLSEALKAGTEEAHKEAESVHFVKNFIRGRIDRSLYALFVAQMFHVYRRLEKELEKHAPQNFPDCHFPKELNRFEALREDIDFWQGSGDEPPISPATQDYLDRITFVAEKRPLLLLAHAYTRYLGDLSGGKILARVAKRALHLGSGIDGLTEGLAFYDFPLLRGSVKAFKDRYRQALNDLHFEDTDEVVHAIVEEANVAFLLNMRLFEELDVIGSVPGASVRPIDDVYRHTAKVRRSKKSQPTEQSSAQCPFANMSGASSFQHLHNHESIEHLQKEGFESHSKTCPWPFILLHDPKTGMRRWQTWIMIGLVLMYSYQQYVSL